MPTITISELLNALENMQKSPKILTIKARVNPDLLKTNNPFKNVVKEYRANYILGANYENSVNRQREREEKESNFVAKNRQWGTQVNNFLVEHNGEHYLRLQELRDKYESHFFEGNEEIPFEKIAPFIPKNKEGTSQGLDKEIRYRNLKLSNILSIRYDGIEFELERS